MSERNWIAPRIDGDAELEAIIEQSKRNIQACFVGVSPCRATVKPALAKIAQEGKP